jgi:hypothetical protein
MAMNPMYFQVLSPQQANPMGYGIQQGAQSAGLMQDARLKAIQAALANAQVPYAGQQAQADLALKQAQVPYMQSQTALNIGTLPYLGYKFFSPYMGNYAKLLGIQKGFMDSPTGQALTANNPQTANAATQLTQNVINGNLPIPGMQQPTNNIPGQLPLTPQQIQKLQQAFPQGNQQAIPDAQAVQNAAQLGLQKKTTDASARQKNLYATNIEKTINQIDPDALTQYAGGLGTAQKYGQMALAAAGKESNNYDNYLKSLNAANLMATQVRQFYGDSIQPSMIQRLEQLTNPSTWSTNPTLAKSLFNQTKQILGQELGTYRDAMQSTAPYRAQGAQASQAQMPSMSKTLNGTTYHKINGQWRPVISGGA